MPGNMFRSVERIVTDSQNALLVKADPDLYSGEFAVKLHVVAAHFSKHFVVHIDASILVGVRLGRPGTTQDELAYKT